MWEWREVGRGDRVVCPWLGAHQCSGILGMINLFLQRGKLRQGRVTAANLLSLTDFVPSTSPGEGRSATQPCYGGKGGVPASSPRAPEPFADMCTGVSRD